VDYILYSLRHPDAFTAASLMASYWEELINGLLYEIYFKQEMEALGVMVSTHLPALEPLGTEPVQQLKNLFDKLYAFEHPLRKSLYNLSLVPRIATIKKEAEKVKSSSVGVEEDDE
ncbi:MAG TPA: hypothetical protein PLJ21_09585, partial [Pseudobdellovibrionaceae bacterium]|nr:hypothetical protein [Pseudobdellovibrionaceae bacterium]